MRRCLRAGFALGALGLAAGCATRQLAPDFERFSAAYAHDMNWQMLLNLARLDQGHPAYFMAIGEIRLARSQSSGLTAGGSTSRNTTEALARTVSTALGGTFSGNTASTVSPTFSFIPINSEEAARQLLQPVSVEVFALLYQQGWPMDQLLRVLVERIEVDVAGGRRVVLVNSPTRGTPDSFARFVRAAEFVRALQRNGALRLAAAPAAPGAAGPGTGSGSAPGASRPRFIADPTLVAEALEQFRDERAFSGAEDSLANLRAAFATGLAVGAADPAEASAGDGPARVHAVLILRSFRHVLEAVAQEQRAFDALAADPTFLARLPERQRRPVLRTDWGDAPARTLHAPLITARYHGHHYQVTDPLGDPADLDARWHRDVFRLLVNLSAQVTVDITKFQRQVLELGP